MRLRLFELVAAVGLSVLCAAPAAAQSASTPQPAPAEEQNGPFRDTLVRMKIEREEAEHKKLRERAEQLREDALLLAREATGGRLPRSLEKKLKEIEKSARQIRADSGGGDDSRPLEEAPSNLEEALRRLGDTSARLNDNMDRTSRHVVSAAVISEANEILELVKIIRGYLN